MNTKRKIWNAYQIEKPREVQDTFYSVGIGGPPMAFKPWSDTTRLVFKKRTNLMSMDQRSVAEGKGSAKKAFTSPGK